VLLHEQELLSFIQTWQSARELGLVLPASDDPNCASLDTLLWHVLWWARDYMIWTCEKLELPDPGIKVTPQPDTIVAELDSYVEHLLERWREPLSNTPEDSFYKIQHKTRWGIDYPVEALLEHAVVHPMRHRLQLQELWERGR
jgi:uncharacterized damage-inducible protein DinB